MIQKIILWICFALIVCAIFLLLTGQLPSECREDKWYSAFTFCDFAGDQY